MQDLIGDSFRIMICIMCVISRVFLLSSANQYTYIYRVIYFVGKYDMVFKRSMQQIITMRLN